MIFLNEYKKKNQTFHPSKELNPNIDLDWCKIQIKNGLIVQFNNKLRATFFD